jgi:IclR family transcriptional regulator, acetate operon repressor
MSSLLVAGRVMEAVEFLAARESARLDEVAGVLGIHKSNALRLLSTLREREWVVINDAHTRYSLGPRLIGIGRAAVPLDLGQAMELAEQLRDLTRESAHVSMRVDDYMLTIGRMESHHELKATTTIGARDPLHATAVGKAHLATLDDAELRRQIDTLDLTGFTGHTKTSKTALLKEIALVRRNRYAINDQESQLGTIAIAVPLLGDSAQPLSLSISGPAQRFSLKVVKQIVPEILHVVEPHNALPR